MYGCWYNNSLTCITINFVLQEAGLKHTLYNMFPFSYVNMAIYLAKVAYYAMLAVFKQNSLDIVQLFDIIIL